MCLNSSPSTANFYVFYKVFDLYDIFFLFIKWGKYSIDFMGDDIEIKQESIHHS